MIALLRRLEVRTLILLGCGGAALWAFLAIAEGVGEGETAGIDRTILLMFREPGRPADPLGPRVLEEAIRDVTALGGFTVLTLVTVLATAVLWAWRRRRQAIVFAVTVGLAQLSADLVKTLVERPRPDLVPHASYVYSHSFPSGHSALSAACFFTLAAVLSQAVTRRRARVFVFSVATLLVLGIGLSRIYLGVHWPSDVLAGWTFGAAWALAGRVALGEWLRQAPPSRGGEAGPETVSEPLV